MGSCISVDQPVIQRRGGGGNRRQIAPPYQTSCSSSPRSKDDGSSTLVGSPSSQGSGRPCLLLSPTDSSVISDADVERLLKEFVTCRSLHSRSTTTRHDQRVATGDSIAISDVAQHVAAGEFPNPLVISGTVLMGQSPQQHGSIPRDAFSTPPPSRSTSPLCCQEQRAQNREDSPRATTTAVVSPLGSLTCISMRGTSLRAASSGSSAMSVATGVTFFPTAAVLGDNIESANVVVLSGDRSHSAVVVGPRSSGLGAAAVDSSTTSSMFNGYHSGGAVMTGLLVGLSPSSSVVSLMPILSGQQPHNAQRAHPRRGGRCAETAQT